MSEKPPEHMEPLPVAQKGGARETSKPPWIRVRLPSGESYGRVKALMRSKSLHTVCEEARCPNMAECWSSGTATFLILGEICTRNCRFCAVSSGVPRPWNPEEPDKILQAVTVMELRHVVVTSVTRDDLPDGGASAFSRTIEVLRGGVPRCSVEVLIPDFGGDRKALEKVLKAEPHILAHNMETVGRLYGKVRPGANYGRSLEILRLAAAWGGNFAVKSGIMVGLGEHRREILQVMDDLRSAGCQILTIGQYLSPGGKHLPVERFWSPEEFEELRTLALGKGFLWVESAPLVRSSYHAHEQTRHWVRM